MRLKISEMIDRYNENYRQENEQKMTQKRLSSLCSPGKESQTAQNQISKYNLGKTPVINMKLEKKICKVLNCTCEMLGL